MNDLEDGLMRWTLSIVAVYPGCHRIPTTRIGESHLNRSRTVMLDKCGEHSMRWHEG